MVKVSEYYSVYKFPYSCDINNEKLTLEEVDELKFLLLSRFSYLSQLPNPVMRQKSEIVADLLDKMNESSCRRFVETERLR